MVPVCRGAAVAWLEWMVVCNLAVWNENEGTFDDGLDFYQGKN